MGQLPETADVVVIGGGVIGLTIARALALRGVRHVLLVERARLGAEASSAAAGMLAPQAEADDADGLFNLCCQSRDMYLTLAEALREETGIDSELDRTGTLYLAFTEHDQKEIEHRYDWQVRAGLTVQKLNPTDARTLEPCISESVLGALKFPNDIQVENRRLLSGLIAANKTLGVRLMTGTTVESIRINRGRIEGAETSRGFVSTGTIIVSGGAWSSFIKVGDAASPNPRIEPVRGQMVCFDSTDSSPSIARHVIYSPRGYLVPRRDGRVLAGSTTEQAGFDKEVTASGVHSILSNALEISPRISEFPLIGVWAGLRPRAPDSLPVLGPCAEIRGLVFATGHYRNGILLAPITGELIAGAIVDNLVSSELSAFSPDRFAIVGANP
ncbi:MAG TPA: glycine oxidase ThiO [Pyrinomonadaceae bacterium]|nr:glycine oxidase ThiO [Pyrinomonadaceae bacterium]